MADNLHLVSNERVHEGRAYNLKCTNMEDKHWVCRRAAEELKTIPQIYHEEASSASANLETASQFPTYKSVKTAMYRKRAQRRMTKSQTNKRTPEKFVPNRNEPSDKMNKILFPPILCTG
ncbi:hypothetical protein T4D_12954 [Trichinella pseudospiralis]|uniref:FLYWCH-type domain-containing protein n=1 Tax=Trichinella pseudospiralis TaxID=6337 RepID=A0A0V1FBJ3_TRIPS|nr:hypothetical protein T4D_12954 [Trichinella pseudospiralis]